MENLKKFIQSNPQYKSKNIGYISFKDTGVHYLKVLRAESHTQNNYRTHQPEKGALITFLEDGTEKKYFIPMFSKDGKTFHYLFEKFADIPEGTDLVIEYKKKPGSFEGFLDLKVAGSGRGETLKTIQQDEGIPVVEDDMVDPRSFEEKLNESNPGDDIVEF